MASNDGDLMTTETRNSNQTLQPIATSSPLSKLKNEVSTNNTKLSQATKALPSQAAIMGGGRRLNKDLSVMSHRNPSKKVNHTRDVLRVADLKGSENKFSD